MLEVPTLPVIAENDQPFPSVPICSGTSPGAVDHSLSTASMPVVVDVPNTSL